MSSSVIHSKKIKQRNALWFLTPTQLLIQGQWWSNLSTHQLQIAQCLDLGDLITLQSGQMSVGFILRSNSIKLKDFVSGLRTPGS